MDIRRVKKPRRPKSVGGKGGYRPGAGRKPTKVYSVPHRARPDVRSGKPMLVSWRIKREVVDLGRQHIPGVLEEACRAHVDQHGYGLTRFTLIDDDVYLVWDAESRDHLARGLQGLSIRIARRFNRIVGRKGKFFEERYESRSDNPFALDDERWTLL